VQAKWKKELTSSKKKINCGWYGNKKRSKCENYVYADVHDVNQCLALPAVANRYSASLDIF
jgi:hypothetical protein